MKVNDIEECLKLTLIIPLVAALLVASAIWTAGFGSYLPESNRTTSEENENQIIKRGAVLAITVFDNDSDAEHLTIQKQMLSDYSLLEEALQNMQLDYLFWDTLCNNEENRDWCEKENIRPPPVSSNISLEELARIELLLEPGEHTFVEWGERDGVFVETHSVPVYYEGNDFRITLSQWSQRD